MNSYRVFDQSPLGLEIALRGGTGRFHIARTSTDVPTVGTELAGVQPWPGLGTLLAAAGGRSRVLQPSNDLRPPASRTLRMAEDRYSTDKKLADPHPPEGHPDAPLPGLQRHPQVPGLRAS